jgi:hypothetical protein
VRGPDPDQADYIQGDPRYPVNNLTPHVFIQRRTEPGWHFRTEPAGMCMIPQGRQGHLYTHPFPVNDRQFLVSYKVNPADHYQDVANAYALYLLDVDGRHRAIHADPSCRAGIPLPLVARAFRRRLNPPDPHYAAGPGGLCGGRCSPGHGGCRTRHGQMAAHQ